MDRAGEGAPDAAMVPAEGHGADEIAAASLRQRGQQHCSLVRACRVWTFARQDRASQWPDLVLRASSSFVELGASAAIRLAAFWSLWRQPAANPAACVDRRSFLASLHPSSLPLA